MAEVLLFHSLQQVNHCREDAALDGVLAARGHLRNASKGNMIEIDEVWYVLTDQPRFTARESVLKKGERSSGVDSRAKQQHGSVEIAACSGSSQRSGETSP